MRDSRCIRRPVDALGQCSGWHRQTVPSLHYQIHHSSLRVRLRLDLHQLHLQFPTGLPKSSCQNRRFPTRRSQSSLTTKRPRVALRHHQYGLRDRDELGAFRRGRSRTAVCGNSRQRTREDPLRIRKEAAAAWSVGGFFFPAAEERLEYLGYGSAAVEIAGWDFYVSCREECA